MKTHVTYRFRIYPTPAQEKRMAEWENALRFLWNLANEQRRMGLARPRGERVYPSAFDQHKELTELRANLPWLADVPRNVAEHLLIDLDTAWQRCFKRLGHTPRWKRRGVDGISFCEAHAQLWRLTGSVLSFPKLGRLRVVDHRKMAGGPKSCTITRDVDQWFASISCEIDAPDPPSRAEPTVAIDRGIVNAIADSDGRLVPSPRFYERAMARLAHAQRVVSRRQKGSKNREKAKLRVAKLHRKIRRQREHFLHVESARYAKSHGVVVVEKLNVAGMARGRSARGIADAGWSAFVTMLRYKLAANGGSVVEVPPEYSSQTCAACGAVDVASRRTQSEFRCTSCGHEDHADLNAAKILKSRANRSALPVEATGSNSGLRSRKAKIQLRTPRKRSMQASAISADAITARAGIYLRGIQ